MQTLVLGAGGFLGLNIVDALVAGGALPRCGHRRRSNLIPLRRRKLPLVVADLADRDSLAAAFRGVATVVHAAGHYPRDSRDRAATLARSHAEMKNVLDACAASGVTRLVYLSSTATVAPRKDGRPSTEADVYPFASGIGPYHDAKWIMEELALCERRFEVVIACPGACLGPWDLRVGTSALIVATAHRLRPPHPDGPVALIDVRDVARAVTRLVAAPAPPRRVLLVAQMMRLHTLLHSLARRYGAPPPAPPLAPEVARALADAEEARVAHTPERPRLSREIVDLVLHGPVIDSRLGAELIGGFIPLADTLDAFDAWARRLGIIPPAAEPARLGARQ